MSEPRFVEWGAWEPALTLAFREIRDLFRDWRLVFPIVTLTLLFPVVATLTAQAVFDFMNRYGGNLIFRQANPFLLLVVGFFPITFSLVIALETFVGEKERRSLEPLLATPLSDGQLYLGKMVASLIPPLAGSYLGVGAYLLGLYLFQGWIPPLSLLAQVLALTTAEALVMVSGAVVVSSQTTSVRAANLLASFIILPMAFLIQAEAVVMFWGRYGTLWWILAFLLLCNVLLVRMGTRLFNREELLGREIDVVDVRRLWRAFRRYLAWDWWWFGRPPRALPRSLRWLGWVAGLYLRELPAVLGRSRGGLAVGLASAVGAVALGWSIALRYPAPFSLGRLGSSFLGGVTAGFVLANNLRALAVGTVLGVFSFGVLSVAPLLVTLGAVSYVSVQFAQSGYDPLTFILAIPTPHGVLEIPAAFLWCALAVRLGATFVVPPQGMTVGEAWLQALADFLKVALALSLPLLVIAAWIEAHVTPLIAFWVYGGG